jgi:hypothetical protein
VLSRKPDQKVGLFCVQNTPRRNGAKNCLLKLLSGMLEVFKKELCFEQSIAYISTQLFSIKATMAKQSGKSVPKSVPAKSSPAPKKAPAKNSDASGKDNQAEKRSRGTGAKDAK